MHWRQNSKLGQITVFYHYYSDWSYQGIPWSFASLLWSREMAQCNWGSTAASWQRGTASNWTKHMFPLQSMQLSFGGCYDVIRGSADAMGALQRLSPGSFRCSHAESIWSLEAQTATTAETLLCLIANCWEVSLGCVFEKKVILNVMLFSCIFKNTSKWRISSVCHLEN